MSKVFEICIANKSGSGMVKIPSVDVVAKKGIINDRYFNDNNEPDIQITFIESENIDYYNEKFNLKIPYLNFRRNIVTKGIKLNDLIGKELLINQTKIKGIDLCRPCKELQEKLGLDNFIKEFLKKGGLRCEILTSANIKVGDEIKVL